MKQITEILKRIYFEPVGKDKLAKLLDVKTTKTIENNILKYNKMNNTFEKEIIYDISIRKYRFNVALPTYIPDNIIFKYMGEYINNEYIKDDFEEVLNFIESNIKDKCNTTLIETKSLSPLMQKIIQLKLALNYNMSIKIDYLGNKGNLEVKYVKPHKIYFSGYTHYLYASYHEDNSINSGEMRTFSINGIKSLEFYKLENEILEKNIKGNAWGEFNNNILLNISGVACKYFKRENIFRDPQFELISLENDGSMIVKMNYNNEKDIINIIQKWMPDITFYKHTNVSERIYKQIKENFVNLTLKNIV